MTYTGTMYAAIEGVGSPTGAVYGIGRTEAAAIADAERIRCEGYTYRAVPCTPAAFRFVKENGGAPSRLLSVTTRGVMLREEEG